MARDDYDSDDRYDDNGPPFPVGVRVAGIIWILVGTFGVAANILNIAAAGAQGPGADKNPGGGCCGGLFALAFLVCGIQTVNGSASDTRGNAVGSLVLATLQVLIAVAAGLAGVGAFGPAQNMNMDPAALLVVALLVGAMGTLLGTAGILGLLGRTQYKTWRKFHRPSKKARRRDDEDEDDRPRRRRD